MNDYLLHEKVLKNDLKGVQEIIESKVALDDLDKHGQTALHWAVFGGYLEIAKELLNAGANPNIVSSDGVTPKWRAVDFGLVEMESLIASFGGKISGTEKFSK